MDAQQEVFAPSLVLIHADPAEGNRNSNSLQTLFSGEHLLLSVLRTHIPTGWPELAGDVSICDSLPAAVQFEHTQNVCICARVRAFL